MSQCAFSKGDEAEIKTWRPNWFQKITQREQISRQGQKGKVVFRTRSRHRWVVVVKFNDGKSVAFDSQELSRTGNWYSPDAAGQ